MTALEMWEEFCAKAHISASFEAWSFGADGDALADLTFAGIKTATSSALALYELEGTPFPKAGEYSVILNSAGDAVCVIRTERVFAAGFDEVSEAHAWKEGEGDRSLSYWHRVHEAFFRQELQAAGLGFQENMPVLCEEFVRVYP